VIFLPNAFALPISIFVFYENQFQGNEIKRVRTFRPLASYSQYPYEPTDSNIRRLRTELAHKIKPILDAVNQGGAGANLTLGEFIAQKYWPRLDWRLTVPADNELHIEPSTIKGYKDIFKNHVEQHAFAKTPLETVTQREARHFLESLPQKLSHQTHLRIKNFLSGVFDWALQESAFYGTNPVEGVKVGGAKKKSSDEGLTIREKKIRASQEHAYTLEEVAEMLDKLPEPARTVCAVAAFTGLSRSELRGLKWTDYDGATINVQRKVWGQHIGEPKTEARERRGVPVIPLLRKMLAKCKAQFPPIGEKWIFRGEKLHRPLNLDNLSRKDMPTYINGAWFGWHAFRRGLGTRLYENGTSDKDVQAILRRANVATTMAYYVLPNREQSDKALRKLDKTLRSKYGIKA
jgi:integrase